MSIGLAVSVIPAAANAQDVPSIAIYNGRTFLAARITLGVDFPPVESRAFTWTPPVPLKKDAVLSARGVISTSGEDQMWSISERDFTLGQRTVKYPLFGIVNFPSTGNYTVIASTTTVRVNLKVGEALQSDSYVIEAKRPIGAGETIPTLRLVGKDEEYIMSIEPSNQTNKKGLAKPQPYLTIAKHAKQSSRDSALEAWRLTIESFEKGFPPIQRLP